jgi:hypothetical protein
MSDLPLLPNGLAPPSARRRLVPGQQAIEILMLELNLSYRTSDNSQLSPESKKHTRPRKDTSIRSSSHQWSPTSTPFSSTVGSVITFSSAGKTVPVHHAVCHGNPAKNRHTRPIDLVVRGCESASRSIPLAQESRHGEEYFMRCYTRTLT